MITYIWAYTGFCFLSLVTDGYSHKIVGWVLAQSLAFHYTKDALRQVISKANKPLKRLIHPSDSGGQYAYESYTDILRKEGVRISMTEKGDPLENAVTERINGILKQEWLHFHDFRNMDESGK